MEISHDFICSDFSIRSLVFYEKSKIGAYLEHIFQLHRIRSNVPIIGAGDNSGFNSLTCSFTTLSLYIMTPRAMLRSSRNLKNSHTESPISFLVSGKPSSRSLLNSCMAGSIIATCCTLSQNYFHHHSVAGKHEAH